jgi:hypothetical protein
MAVKLTAPVGRKAAAAGIRFDRVSRRGRSRSGSHAGLPGVERADTELRREDEWWDISIKDCVQ